MPKPEYIVEGPNLAAINRGKLMAAMPDIDAARANQIATEIVAIFSDPKPTYIMEYDDRRIKIVLKAN